MKAGDKVYCIKSVPNGKKFYHIKGKYYEILR